MPGDISPVYQTFRDYAVEAGVGDVKRTGTLAPPALPPRSPLAARSRRRPHMGQTLGYRELSTECRAPRPDQRGWLCSPKSSETASKGVKFPG